MKHLRILLFGVLTSCTGNQYVSTPNYIPVNNEKGDFSTQFFWNYFQFGYTFTDKWTVHVTGFSRKNNGGIFHATALSKENGGEYV